MFSICLVHGAPGRRILGTSVLALAQQSEARLYESARTNAGERGPAASPVGRRQLAGPVGSAPSGRSVRMVACGQFRQPTRRSPPSRLLVHRFLLPVGIADLRATRGARSRKSPQNSFDCTSSVVDATSSDRSGPRCDGMLGTAMRAASVTIAVAACGRRRHGNRMRCTSPARSSTVVFGPSLARSVRCCPASHHISASSKR